MNYSVTACDSSWLPLSVSSGQTDTTARHNNSIILRASKDFCRLTQLSTKATAEKVDLIGHMPQCDAVVVVL